MNKKELSAVSLAIILVLLFISSILFFRYNSQGIISTFTTGVQRIIGTKTNKNFSDSKFVPSTAEIDSLDICNLDIKVNSEEIELIPAAQANANSNIKRFTYKTKSDLADKIGSIDIACVSFEPALKQLKTTLETADKQNPDKIKEVFGMKYAEILKLDDKSLYRLFLVKRNTTNTECKQLDNPAIIGTIHSIVEKKLDNQYVDCTYTLNDNNGGVTRVVKYKYLFDKDSKYLLQIGESDADLITDDLLIINRL
jgi:hypothetical protein